MLFMMMTFVGCSKNSNLINDGIQSEEMSTLPPALPADNPGTNAGMVGCIPPQVNLAYPLWGKINTSSSEIKIVKPFNWETHTSIRNLLEREFYGKDVNFISQSQTSLIYRFHEDDLGSIWMSYTDFLETDVPLSSLLLRYDIASQSVSMYSEETNNGPIPYRLFLAKNGALWGIGREGFGHSWLSRYDDRRDTFEIILDENNFDALGAHGAILSLQEDGSGMFWLIIEKQIIGTITYGLYSFNPDTLELRENPAISILSPIRLAISPDNKIWIAVLDEISRKINLAIFNPLTQEIEYYNDPQFISDSSMDGFESEDLKLNVNLYFDRLGNLWVDDRGWFDFSSPYAPQWYRVIRSPVFIEEQAFSEIPYIWRRPLFMSQSSNGIYWFGSPVGIVSLDGSSGKWCHITTAISRVVEDSQNNLWIVAYGVLYKYPVQP